jgi:tRNA(fMet)-specific endonuclease VapC
MTTFALDTSAVVDFIRGSYPQVRDRMLQAQRAGPVVVSSIVFYELMYGAQKSDRREQNEVTIRRFLSGPVVQAPFDFTAAAEAAKIRRELERPGERIGHYDLLIAGHARANGWTLVTGNRDEFSRIAGLDWEDWRS